MLKSLSAGAVFTLTTLALPELSCAQGEQARPSQRIDSSWLSFDAATKTARFKLIGALTGLNGGLNFNGFRDGELTLTVPLGWTVDVHFKNRDGILPHSAVVIPGAHPLPIAPGASAFDRAFTLRVAAGIPPEGEDDMRFVADKGGKYLIFCGVPGHGAAGMWIRLKVSGSVRAASLTATRAGS